MGGIFGARIFTVMAGFRKIDYDFAKRFDDSVFLL